jgi:protein-disulfide isomerase
MSSPALEMRGKRLWQLIAALGVAAVAVVALILVSQSGAPEKPAAPQRGERAAGAAEVNRLLAGIPQQGTVLGDPRAPVTITEFADLQCPFCAEAATQGLPGVIDRYVRAGKVKLDLRLLSFLGPDSEEGAAMAAAAAAQDRLWQFTELFYRNQGAENSGYVTDSFLRRMASGVRGLDVSKALAYADGDAAARQVAAWSREGEIRGVRGTPTFLLERGDGSARQLPVDPRDAASFSGPIERALAD